MAMVYESKYSSFDETFPYTVEAPVAASATSSRSRLFAGNVSPLKVLVV